MSKAVWVQGYRTVNDGRSHRLTFTTSPAMSRKSAQREAWGKVEAKERGATISFPRRVEYVGLASGSLVGSTGGDQGGT